MARWGRTGHLTRRSKGPIGQIPGTVVKEGTKTRRRHHNLLQVISLCRREEKSTVISAMLLLPSNSSRTPQPYTYALL